MAARSYFRGHPVVRNKQGKGWIWVYEDTRKPLPANGGEVRPCKKCGELFALGSGEVDPCLGVLPGVDNACCGHGIRRQAYVRFENGVVLKNFVVAVSAFNRKSSIENGSTGSPS